MFNSHKSKLFLGLFLAAFQLIASTRVNASMQELQDPLGLYLLVFDGVKSGDNITMRDILSKIYQRIPTTTVQQTEIRLKLRAKFYQKFGVEVDSEQVKKSAERDPHGFSVNDLRALLQQMTNSIPVVIQKAQELIQENGEGAEKALVINTYSLIYILNQHYLGQKDSDLEVSRAAEAGMDTLIKAFPYLKDINTKELEESEDPAALLIGQWLKVMTDLVKPSQGWCIKGYCVSGTNLLLSAGNIAAWTLFAIKNGRPILDLYNQIRGLGQVVRHELATQATQTDDGSMTAAATSLTHVNHLHGETMAMTVCEKCQDRFVAKLDKRPQVRRPHNSLTRDVAAVAAAVVARDIVNHHATVATTASTSSATTSSSAASSASSFRSPITSSKKAT